MNCSCLRTCPSLPMLSPGRLCRVPSSGVPLRLQAQPQEASRFQGPHHSLLSRQLWHCCCLSQSLCVFPPRHSPGQFPSIGIHRDPRHTCTSFLSLISFSYLPPFHFSFPHSGKKCMCIYCVPGPLSNANLTTFLPCSGPSEFIPVLWDLNPAPFKAHLPPLSNSPIQ